MVIKLSQPLYTESFRSEFNNTFFKGHPDIYRFINALKGCTDTHVRTITKDNKYTNGYFKRRKLQER